MRSRSRSRSSSLSTSTSTTPSTATAGELSRHRARRRARSWPGPTSTVTVPVRSSSESVAPATTRRPALIITTWSHTFCTSSSRCVAISTEMPNEPSRATSASMSSRPTGSRPAVGSSSSTSSGSLDDRLRELRPLPHARRELADRSEPRFVEADEVEDVGRALAGGARGQPAQLAERRDDVGRALVERQAVVLGHVAEAGPHADRIACDVECRTPRCDLPSGGRARAAGGTSSSCPRRWRPRDRCARAAPRRSGRRARSSLDNAWSVRRDGEGAQVPRRPRVCHPVAAVRVVRSEPGVRTRRITAR